MSKRRPESVYEQGGEPDARFSMANERTALAWMRTALGFVAAGVGLASLARVADMHYTLHLVAAVMCLAGGGLAVIAVLGWRRREIALRLNAPLPSPAALPWLAGVVAAIGIAVAFIAVLQRS